MSLIVEDGTGLTNSNSYVSIVEADAYFTDRGIISWNGSATKDYLLIAATDYLDSVYGRAFKGIKKTQKQSLSFPRYNQGSSMLAVSQSRSGYPGFSPFLNDALPIPNELKKACFELARIAVLGDLYPEATSADESGLDSKMVKVGPITVEKKLRSSQNKPIKNIYHKVEFILQPLLSNSNSVIR